MIKIGKLREEDVEISDKCPNKHILITGISGSGKSIRIGEIVDDLVTLGETVIVIDINGENMFNLNCSVNQIKISEDGMNLELLKFSEEEKVMGVSYVVDVFSRTMGLGVRQEGALREAFLYAIENRNDFNTESEAITVGLTMQDSDVADGVYSKLWELFQSKVLKKNGKSMNERMCNVLSFESINSSMQRVLIELFLAEIWKNVRLKKRESNENLWIVIDEFQNFIPKKNSVLVEMMKESRKYGVNLILATQSTNAFAKEILTAINQAGTKLYFKPAANDIRRIAFSIDAEKSKFWNIALQKMNVGESVAVGNFVLGEKKIAIPILIHSRFNDVEYNKTEIKNLKK